MSDTPTREDAVRARVAAFARAEVARSPLYGREGAMTYALGFMQPHPDRSDAENMVTVRGVYAGLRDAGVIP